MMIVFGEIDHCLLNECYHHVIQTSNKDIEIISSMKKCFRANIALNHLINT